jgi:hypothetical protein
MKQWAMVSMCGSKTGKAYSVALAKQTHDENRIKKVTKQVESKMACRIMDKNGGDAQ